ncbi:MAG: DinB family protein [Ignavibacteriales bacterium]|nr:DinB family protein [Ignavibacteriales bacterium]
MINQLNELYGHQAWADAEHWKALEAHPAASEDETIRKRLYHVHLVQRAFLRIVGKEKYDLRKFEDFPDMAALKEWAISCHKISKNFICNLTEEKFAENVTIPWFKDPPLSITIEQALTQAAMHSHYHRGQNAARLRELGGDPPLTDFIAWLWKGKPEAIWK